MTKNQIDKLRSMRSELPTSVRSQYRRNKIVHKYIEDNNIDLLFGHYVEDYFKINVNKKDRLSDQDAVCRQLEVMADYILFAPDAKPLTMKLKYKMYSKTRFAEKIKKEEHLDGIVSSFETEDGFGGDEVIDFLIREGQNYKVKVEQKLLSEDYHDPEININETDRNIIQQYQDFIDLMSKRAKGIKKEQEGIILKNTDKPREAYQDELDEFGPELSRLVRNMKYCRVDQVYCKDALKGTIYFKSLLPDQGATDYDEFDFFDRDHVAALIRLNKRDVTTDLGILIQDMYDLLESIEMNPLDEKILMLYRDVDMTGEDIADCLGIKRQFAEATINKIINRVMEEYERKYEDWYYLNIVKGKYKKCSKCGEIKIANGRYFSARKDEKGGGFYSYCRKCGNK